MLVALARHLRGQRVGGERGDGDGGAVEFGR
jgi:hypothetical protein